MTLSHNLSWEQKGGMAWKAQRSDEAWETTQNFAMLHPHKRMKEINFHFAKLLMNFPFKSLI